MKTATQIYYGTAAGYIAQLSDGTYYQVKQLDRLGRKISKRIVSLLLSNPITEAWHAKPFVCAVPATMNRVITASINSRLASQGQ